MMFHDRSRYLTSSVYCIIATVFILTSIAQSQAVNKSFVQDKSVRDMNGDGVTFKAAFTAYHNRAKRTTYRTTNFYTFGIVPYVFASGVSRTQQNIIGRVMEHYQHFTCIRFVPRRSGDLQYAKDLYNLGHDGYILFVKERTCFGGMGNNGGATRVSCCGRARCVHEIGHSLGLVHEHLNPGSQEFLRINYDQIDQVNKIKYKVAMEDEVVPGYPFDISSPMAERSGISLRTPDLSLETKDFYMFKEISDNHQCPQNNCSNFEMTCVNDGYVTMIQGDCACRCPEGLNPQTGCATVLSEDRTYNRCGAVLELNSDNPSVNFNKFTNQTDMCFWLINAPEGETIVLVFHQFDIAKEFGECADEIEIRYSRIGQGGKRFCGIQSPRLIRSYFNRLMITFHPARRPTYGSHFNITAKLVSNDSLCYNSSDKGFTYRGTVNFTRDYKECRNWLDVAHCPHNPYKFEDMSAGLDANYCRNPGDGLRPWCYIDSSCTRRYCDVCHVDSPYNQYRFSNCLSMKLTRNFCHRGPELYRLNCAKMCSAEFLPPQPSVSNITCSRPPEMQDSDQVDKRNEEIFAVGESVTFRCRHSNPYMRTELKKYCSSTGEWSEERTACLPCHIEKGYTLYNDSCYKIETERKIANRHQAECRSLGGNLADVRTLEEQMFITDLGFKHGATSLYIGAHDMYREGTFRFRDYSLVIWTPWQLNNGNGPGKDCVSTNFNYKWYVVACNVKKKAVCKIPKLRHRRRGGRRCSDSRADCAELLSRDPGMCQREGGTFAFTQCPRTCSRCYNPQYIIIT